MHCVKSQLQGEHVAGSPTTCCGSMTGCVVSLLSMRLNCFRSSRRAGVLVLPLVWCQGDGMSGEGVVACCHSMLMECVMCLRWNEVEVHDTREMNRLRQPVETA